MADTRQSDLVHIKCGGPVDIDPSRSDVRSDLHVQGWAMLGLGVFFLVVVGAIIPPLGAIGRPFALAAPVLWLMAIIGRGPSFNVHRRCPACRRTWKAEKDHKHARPVPSGGDTSESAEPANLSSDDVERSQAEDAYRVMVSMERYMSPHNFRLTVQDKQRVADEVWRRFGLPAARRPKVRSVANFNRLVQSGQLRGVGVRRFDASRHRGLAVKTGGRSVIVTVDRHLSTLIHEIAHAVVYEMGWSDPHGGHGPAFVVAEQEIYALAGPAVEQQYRLARQAVAA